MSQLDTAVDDALVGNDRLRYDKAAKGVLSEKKILAYILKRTIPEFASASLNDIADRYIEGKPLVSVVPVYKDKTNAVRHYLEKQDNPNIHGMQNEDNSITEGSVTFDILFHAKAPGTDDLITLIINVEAQKSLSPKNKKGEVYPLMKRAVYYISRLISSQKETEFTGSDYGKIKKVYSIWIYMESPHGKNAINRYQLKEQHLLHRYKEPIANYDLMGIIFVYLGNNRTRDRLMHLLYLLFVKKMKSEDLLTTLHDEYDIDLTAKGKEDVTTMCNLGEGLYERAMEKGLEKGIEKGIKKGIKKGIERGIERGVEQEKRNSERKDREAALEMIKDGLSFEQIARYMKLSIEAVAEIAKKNKLI